MASPAEEGTGKVDELARLLARRVAASGQAADGEVSVAEVRRRLVPYEVARADLALASKAEYDLALLALLAREEYLESEDRELVQAVREELDSPEPGLGFLSDYAASHLRLRLGDLAAESADSPAARRATAEGAPATRTVKATGGGGTETASDRDAASGSDDAGVGSEGPAPGGEAPGARAEGTASAADAVAGPTACWSCDRDLPDEAGEARFCVWCGADLTVRPCAGCGTELQSDWHYCPSCGREAGAGGR